MQVLVVSEDPQQAEALAALLRSRAHAVSCAHGAAEACRSFEREPAPLVLLDLAALSDVAGLVQALRALPQGTRALLLGTVDPEALGASLRRLREAPLDDFLLWPGIAPLLDARLQLAERRAAERARADEGLPPVDGVQTLLDGLPLLVGVLGLDEQLRYLNPYGARLLGYASGAELVGARADTLLAEEERAQVSLRVALLMAGEPGERRVRALQHRSGRHLQVELLGFRLRFLGEEALGVVGHDVTESRARHAQQLTQDWLAGVGTLAAGVAHELNNPLAYVGSNLAFALDELEPLLRGERLPEPRAREVLQALGEAREGAGRISRIVHDLRTFTREQQEQRGPVDVREVLDVALRLTERELHHRARVVREEAPGALSAWGNAGQLTQVLVQLLLNAAQALPEGRAEQHTVRVVARGEPEGWVCVSVRDTGHGIPPEHLPRLFTPFFTTRAPGRGLGMGLFVSHNLVKEMGGSIRVRSRPGQGSTFEVLLPCTPAPALPLPAPEPAGPEPRARLLLLDDDARVCKAFERLLRPYHDVTTFQRGHAALEWLRAGAPVDVLFCDLALPDMSGLELYRALLQRRPELLQRVVLVTGSADAPAARALLDTLAQRKLDKPFERDQVLQRVREVRTGARGIVQGCE